MSLALVKKESPLMFFVGERTTFDRYPLLCRLCYVFVYLPSIICCPKRTQRVALYMFKKWKWADINGVTIASTEEKADRYCGTDPLRFILPEYVDNPLGKEPTVLPGHRFPNSVHQATYEAMDRAAPPVIHPDEYAMVMQAANQLQERLERPV